MKKISVLGIALLLLLTGVAFADHDGEVEARVELKIMQDGDLIEVSADDLEIGESREFVSDSGKEVVLTRLEEGFSLTVDGEEIDLGLGGGHMSYSYGHGEHGDHDGKKIKKIIKKIVECEGGEECEEEVKIHKMHHGEGAQMVFITKGDDDGGEHEVVIHGAGHGEGHHGKKVMFIGEGDGHHGAKVIQLHRKSAIEHLEEDGVLDRLSTSDRDMIIESLQKMEKKEREVKVKVLGAGDGEKIWIDDDGEVHEIEVDVEIEEEN